MKILVTGGTGLLGWWVVKELVDRGFIVYATYNQKTPHNIGNEKWVKLNLEDVDKTICTVRELKPDVIIHCAAYTDVDGCELRKDHAYRVNYLGTKALAHVSRDLNCYFIYVSTDYVFDGERGFYTEEDIPNPVNYYGLTKLLGEVATLSILPEKSCVVRVSGLYGISPTGKKNFGLIALETLLRDKEVKAFYDQYLSPTYIKSLAQCLSKLIERNVTGIIHIAGERVSRYEFALKLAEILQKDKSLVKPVSMAEVNLVAKRPKDSSLNTNKARQLGLTIPPLIECLEDFVKCYYRFFS